MGAGTSLDWIVVGAGYFLVGIGALLLLWAIRGDRSRGRRRCPKCWYSMDGIAPSPREGGEEWRCPECGTSIRHDRQLYKSRRRPMWASVATLIVLVGFGTTKVPDARRAGWAGAVPSSLLVMFAPIDELPPLQRFTRPVITRDPDGKLVLTTPAPAVAVNATTAYQLCVEVWHRYDRGELAEWQARLLAKRFLEESKARLADCIAVPGVWIAGRPFPVEIDHSTLIRPIGGSIGALEIVGAEKRTRHVFVDAPRVAESIELEMIVWNSSGQRVLSQTAVLPIHIAATPSEAFEPAEEPGATRLVQEALDIRIVHAASDIAVVTDDRSDQPRWEAIDFGIGFDVEILFEDRVVAWGKGDVNWNYPVFKDWHELVRVHWEDGALQQVLRNPERALFVVTGNPGEVFEQYAREPFTRPRPAAWRGRFESPVRIDSSWKRSERN